MTKTETTDIEIASAMFMSAHPELHHYTTFEGLEGIVKTNSLWATYYRDLNDITEVFHSKSRLVSALVPRFQVIAEKQTCWKTDWDKRKKIEPSGALEKFSERLIDTIFHDLFGVGNPVTSCKVFISSFCTHSAHTQYEKENGLLSQWRGYGGSGGFCVVFDTEKMADLLGMEWDSHSYAGLFIREVVYDQDGLSLETLFPDLIRVCEGYFAAYLTDGMEGATGNGFTEFVSNVTRFKHRGFKEESEARIIAILGSEELYRTAKIEHCDFTQKPSRNVGKSPCGKNVISLFDGLMKKLPINRIIVGPSSAQDDNVNKAKELFCSGIEVVPSKTPFIR